MPNVNGRRIWISAMVLCVLGGRWAQAYIDLAPTLAKVVGDSTSIAIVQVQKFTAADHTVVLLPIAALKGSLSVDPVRHDVQASDGGSVPRPIVQWAQPGARAVLFMSRTTELVCMGQGWYQVRTNSSGLWKLGPPRPDLPLAYFGTVGRLCDGVEAMLAGKEAVLTVLPYGDDTEGASFDLPLNRPALPDLVRVQRIHENISAPGQVMAASSSPTYLIGTGPVDATELPRLMALLQSNDPGVLADTAHDVRWLGRSAAGAAPSLAALLNSPAPAVRFSAAAALSCVTPRDTRGVEVLSKGLDSTDAPTRLTAIHESGLGGKAAAPLADKLAGFLDDPDDATRMTALVAISTLGAPSDKAVAALIPLLDNANMAVDAADALGHIGQTATAALPRLAKMLASDQSDVRWAAVRAMSQIGGDGATPAVKFMIKALPGATEIDGYNMMIYLSLLGPVAKDAIPAVQSGGVRNPVLPSATLWAIQPTKGFPWQGGWQSMGGPGGFGGGRGPGGGMGGGPGGGDIFKFIYESYIEELGYRLRPSAKMLAQEIIDGTAGAVPDWGYKILACGGDETVGVLAGHLTDDKLATRERAAVGLGFMGNAAESAIPAIHAAIDKSTDAHEKLLLQYTLRQLTAE